MDKDSSDGCVSLSASLSWLVSRFGRLEFLALAVVVCFERVHLFAFGEVLDITVVGHVTSSLWRSCRVHAICDIKSSFVADVPLRALPARGCPARQDCEGSFSMTVGNQRSRVMGLERLNGRLLERDVNIDVSSADGVRCSVVSDDDEADDDNAHIIMPTICDAWLSWHVFCGIRLEFDKEFEHSSSVPGVCTGTRASDGCAGRCANSCRTLDCSYEPRGFGMSLNT